MSSASEYRYLENPRDRFDRMLQQEKIIPLKDSDSLHLPYPFHDESYLDPVNQDHNGGLFLNPPSNVQNSVTYDPDSNIFNVTQSMGGLQYHPPSYMTFDEYMKYDFDHQLKTYWKQRHEAEQLNKQNSRLVPPIKISSVVFDRIFGGTTVDIRPQGTAELTFAYNHTRTDNPALPERQRKISTFDFNEKIQLNVIGKIGEKLKLTTNYNTEATFDFENQMKLEYTGYEDEIIKKIEAGNVSLPLSGTLITGSQSLFGIKTQLQFGKATVTSIFSQQKGKKSEVEVQGGATTTNFEITADNYESGKHFFLAQYFRNNYNLALSALPLINSGINITKVEVWVTNTTNYSGDTRNILALTDLGEHDSISYGPPFGPVVSSGISPLAQNTANNLNPALFNPAQLLSALEGLYGSGGLGLRQIRDYEKITNAKKLSSSEYTFNQKLGYISLNQAMNPDQVLAVAFQYTYQGNTYQVGEFSTDGVAAPNALILKMLKSSNVSPKQDHLLWKIMMKNIYAIGAYQVKPQDFKLDVYYNNPATGTDIVYLPVPEQPLINGKPLIQVLNCDRLNQQLDQTPDGLFDFIDGVTINSQNGRVIFPVTEPFGSFLRSKINPTHDINLITAENKFAYNQLYDSTKYAAQQFPDKNRFKLKGSYKSASGNVISLNAPNIPQGAVIVTAGGVPLTENVDYTVDYALGKVKIINEGILQSGVPIKVSLESNALFSIQSKSLLGARVDYRINKDFNLGATVLRLNERPLTQKVNFGDEPIKNTILGIDGNFRTEAPWLTRLIDKLPLIQTKEMSTLTASMEAAELFPGHSKAIGKDGNSYIDDFEGSTTAIDIKSVGAWFLASTPQGQPGLFPEASLFNSRKFGMNRAKLCWYVIDPLFLRQQSGVTPSHITAADQSNHLVREVLETEIFPNKQSPTGQPINIPTLDLAFYPNERGPYNYVVGDSLPFALGLDPATGKLKNPDTRWGGIQRRIETNDFEAANVEFIQFWMMDPYVRDANGNSTDYTAQFGTAPPNYGELYFDLGNISEDVLRDGEKSFENGLANNYPYDVTAWGHVPSSTVQPAVNAFGVDPDVRKQQDVGLDGLSSTDEQAFFANYLSALQSYSATAYNMTDPNFLVNGNPKHTFRDDPSGDDFHYFRGDDYDAAQTSILKRYKYYNGYEANSPVNDGSSYPTSATTVPNTEDINNDNNLSESESYYQYLVKISPSDISPTNSGNNYITNVYQTSVQTKDGNTKPITWYQFKIPVKEFRQKIGSIEDFKSIRFIRMFMRGFDKPIVMRFARLELVRDEWRKYAFDLRYPGEYIPIDNSSETTFDLGAVNFEENGSRQPVNYVLPPSIERQSSYGTSQIIKLNEQAMSMRVCKLKDGDARAAYKNVTLDVRAYKRLKMFVHAEAGVNTVLKDDDVTCFIRLGSDYTSNYYECEIPLKVTPPGVYDNNSDDDRYKVWRVENALDLPFSTLQTVKQDRNNAMFVTSSGVTLNTPYSQAVIDPNGYSRKITIIGNPNLSALKVIMIGVRNPKKQGAGDGDDGLSKCAEVWVNELRLTDFDEHGGWAATGRVTAKLADFGTATVAGNISTPGWGSLEKKVSERQKETKYGYDISSQLEMAKFLPSKWGVSIPMFVGYSIARSRPQYNPLDPDIELNNVLKDDHYTAAQKDSLRNVTETVLERKSLNFTNVKKDRPKGSKRNNIYDVENLALNFAYTETHNHSVNVEYNNLVDWHGGFTYNFSANPKLIKPFAKSKFLANAKPLALIRDFSFYPYPNRISFLTDVTRHFNENKIRNTTNDVFTTKPTFEKRFNMLRSYDVKYDISKSLKLSYNADNTSRILEPAGRIDTKEKKDSVKRELLSGGTNTIFSQRVKVDYTIPINKFPMLDWMTSTASYGGNYDWTRGPFELPADSLNFGNTIKNSQTKQIGVQMNMSTLYNKIPFFDKVNKKYAGGSGKAKGTGKTNTPSTSKDSTKNKKENQYEIFEHLARVVMMLKNINVNYSDNSGMIIPGYKETSKYFGMNPGANYNGFGWAPGAEFVFGGQHDPRDQLVHDNLMVKNKYLNLPFSKTHSTTLNGRANIEPIPSFKVELTANRTYSDNFSEYFRYDPTSDAFKHESPTESGNFSMSFLSYKTAFLSTDKKTYDNAAFTHFVDYRATMSDRLHQLNPNSASLLTSGFWDGYSATQQEVMTSSFLAAYGGKNPNRSTLNPFPDIPLPNWSMTYDGLNKLEFVKKYFKSVTLRHAYRSSYTVSSFIYDLDYVEAGGHPVAKDVNGDFIPKYQFSTVTISEQFSPLLKVDIAMNNSMTANVELKKDRNISLSYANNQITEINGRELIVGAGYRIHELHIKFFKKAKSDLNLKADVSIRNNQTVIRKVVEKVSYPQAGQIVISVRTSADYQLSERLNIRLFCDRTVNKPLISSSFPTATTNAGLSVRFTLSQ